MKSLTIEIIVSTMNERVYGVINRFQELIDCRTIVTIVHQVTDGREYSIPDGEFKYIRSNKAGLPLSRNLGLQNAEGDIIVPTDDDVEFCDNFRSIIDASFERNPNADLISFKIETPEGEPPYRNYYSRDRVHNTRTLLNVSSVEICLRRKSFQNILEWDRDFGLGAKFPGGLEVVFLQDARRLGKKMFYVNEFLVRHPYESSGKEVSFQKIALRSCVLFRAFKVLGVPLVFLFYLKKRSDFSGSGISFFDYFYYSAIGLADYLKWLRK